MYFWFVLGIIFFLFFFIKNITGKNVLKLVVYGGGVTSIVTCTRDLCTMCDHKNG